jgi:hypothetical protein
MKKNRREYRSSHDVVTYFFPKGVTCNDELFNHGSSTKGRRSDHFELDTEMFLYEVVELGKDQDHNYDTLSSSVPL